MSKRIIATSLIVALLGSVSYVAFAEDEDDTVIYEEVDEVEETVSDVDENLLEQPHDESTVTSPNPSLEGFELAAENDSLALYVEEESLAIKIMNKETDFIWSSTIDNIEEENLNETWQNFARSALSVDYLNRTDQERTETILEEDTQVNIDFIDRGFEAHIVFPSEIEMTLLVELEESTFTVTIPDDQIVEPENARLTSLSLYPFMGATKMDEVGGYMFIPDGPGSLIRYDDESARMDFPYRGRVYGTDQGITTGTALSDTQAPHQVSMPVYGVVHGVDQNALFTVIESGETYSELVAYKAGLSTEFNWITTEYVFRSPYRQPTNRSGTQAVDNYQADRNTFDIALRYDVLMEKDANYIGMAQSYQSYLVDMGVLNQDSKDNPPMRIEFLAGEREPGLLWNRYVTMTPIMDVYNHVQTLHDEGLEEALIIYKGWYDGGRTSDLPNKFPVDSRVGSQSEVLEAQDQLAELGFNLAFQTDYTKAYRQPTRIENNELVEQINTSNLTLYEDQDGEIDYSYLLLTGAKELLERDRSSYEEFGMNHLALMNTPKALFSSFNRGNTFTREENKTHTVELIETMAEYTEDLPALYEPNAYLWHTTSQYLDIPMSDSGYYYMTDSVPFMHIVLKGYLDYYAPFTNFQPNQQEGFLRMMEYGAYPSFYLTSEDPFLLIDTASNNLYTSQFENWKDLLLEQYEAVKELDDVVEDATIDFREVIDEGVVEVTYSNGVTLLVNYTQTAYESEYGTVSELGYLIWEGGE